MGEMEGADLLVDFSHRSQGTPSPFGQGILVREAGQGTWEDAYGVAADLADDPLEVLGLRREDGAVTDHTPLVVDVRIRR